MAANRRHLPLLAAVSAVIATSALTSGCARVQEHKGYIADPVLIESVQPGIDNQASVQATLGRPTFVSQFSNAAGVPIWYYVSRNTRQLAFARPRPTEQFILAIRFDANGNVASVDNIGMEQVASIDPFGEETPTLGRDRGFFSELFGNIGQVGSVSQSGGTADNPRGGN